MNSIVNKILSNKNLNILMRVFELEPEKLDDTQLLNYHKIWLKMKKRTTNNILFLFKENNYFHSYIELLT